MVGSLMDVDLRPLQSALKELGFTSPLSTDDTRYIPRQDALSRQLLNRIRVPTAPTLLLGGPAGCGKSTELIHLRSELQQEFAVFHCNCDLQLDLYRLEEADLYHYVLWRVLSVSQNNPTPGLKLTAEIINEAESRLGAKDRDVDALSQTLRRLLLEIGQVKPVLLLLDGLEKVSDRAFSAAVAPFVRSRDLRNWHSVVVVPYWSLLGWESPAQWENIELLEIPVVTTGSFVQDVIIKRAGDVLEPEAIRHLGSFSGGVVRDGLQLAASAVRFVLDEGVPMVSPLHARRATDELRSTYKRIFSDDLGRVRDFLKHVTINGELPADPLWRTRMLASGAVLPGPEGTFFVHPVLTSF